MVRAVLLDFYGTLARATRWVSIDDVLAAHGYERLPPDALRRWWNEGVDGIEHVEHSQSRDHYLAWQRERLLAMLAETDVHPGEYEEILTKLRAGAAERVLEAYPEVQEVLSAIRAAGVRIAICSNWDWDLSEALTEADLTQLVDVQVSSAWVGARKPHPRIFRSALEKVGVPAAETLFVGDSWGPDVEGPRAVGMAPAYLTREGHWPDPGAPADLEATGVAIIEDLRGVLPLLFL